MYNTLYFDLVGTGITFCPWSQYSGFLELCDMMGVCPRAGESTGTGIYFYLK